MEAVDSEVSVTCTDMRLVRKMFQLALLCTRRHPSERPTMHEIARVLVSLLPASSTKSISSMNYGRYYADESSEGKLHRTVAVAGSENCSDAQWFVRFGEVISKNSF